MAGQLKSTRDPNHLWHKENYTRRPQEGPRGSKSVVSDNKDLCLSGLVTKTLHRSKSLEKSGENPASPEAAAGTGLDFALSLSE